MCTTHMVKTAQLSMSQLSPGIDLKVLAHTVTQYRLAFMGEKFY